MEIHSGYDKTKVNEEIKKKAGSYYTLDKSGKYL